MVHVEDLDDFIKLMVKIDLALGEEENLNYLNGILPPFTHNTINWTYWRNYLPFRLSL